jgi:hypothetical protein
MILLPFQPDAMTPAQLAAVSYPTRYSGHTHELYAYQLRRWFTWCEVNGLEPLEGIQRAHLELYIRHLGESGLRVSSVNTMMHGVRGLFRFPHIDGLITADPAVYARRAKVHTRRTSGATTRPGPGRGARRLVRREVRDCCSGTRSPPTRSGRFRGVGLGGLRRHSCAVRSQRHSRHRSES